MNMNLYAYDRHEVKAMEELFDYIDMGKNPDKLPDALKYVAITKFPEFILNLKKPKDNLLIQALCLKPALITLMGELSEEVLQEVIVYRPDALEFIKKPSKDVQRLAIHKDPDALRFVRRQNRVLTKLAVGLKPDALEHVRKQTEELQLLAVMRYGRSLRHCVSPTPGVIRAALKQCGQAIQYVSDPTREQVIIAAKNDANVLTNVKDITDDIIREICVDSELNVFLVLQRIGYHISDDLMRLFLETSPYIINKVRMPPSWMQVFVIKQFPLYWFDFMNERESFSLEAQECLYNINPKRFEKHFDVCSLLTRLRISKIDTLLTDMITIKNSDI
jgi:hypothetical protein